MKRKFLATLLSLTMVATMIPSFAFADGENEGQNGMFGLMTSEAITDLYETTPSEDVLEGINENVKIGTTSGTEVVAATTGEIEVDVTTNVEIGFVTDDGKKLPYVTGFNQFKGSEKAGNYVAYSLTISGDSASYVLKEDGKEVASTTNSEFSFKTVERVNGVNEKTYVLYSVEDNNTTTKGEITLDFSKIICEAAPSNEPSAPEKKTISNMTVTGINATYEYTGKAITPKVSIAGLTEGTDFDVDYANNVNPGTATVTIVGKGDYEGTITKTFTIVKTVTSGGDGDSKTETPVVPAKGDTVELKSGDYKVTKSKDGAVEVAFKAPASKKKTSVTIPETVTLADGTKAKVTSIDAKAFKNNKKIKKVKIGKNVTTIGKEAFSGAKNLTSVTVGSKVKTVGDKAFYKTAKLKKVTLPATVTKIGKQAFYGNKKLKTLTIKSKKLTSSKVGKQAFKGMPSKATVKVPKAKVKSYKKIFQKKGLSKKAKVKKI